MECYEMALKLRTSTAQDTSAVPRSHARQLTIAYNSSSRGTRHFLPLQAPACPYMYTHTHTQREKVIYFYYSYIYTPKMWELSQYLLGLSPCPDLREANKENLCVSSLRFNQSKKNWLFSL